MSNEIYNEIIHAFTNQHVSLYRATKKLASIVLIEPIWIDCCINSCYAFTGEYSKAISCPKCQQTRFFEDSKNHVARKKMAFFPLKDRFIIQYNDEHRSQELQYRYKYVSSADYQAKKQYGDIFDGYRYKELIQEGHFSEYRDIALTGSLDGYQIFKQKTDDCWIVLFINANLPPEDRVKKNNLLISTIIPGPNAPSNLNSFLRPVVDELQKLEGTFLYFMSKSLQ